MCFLNEVLQDAVQIRYKVPSSNERHVIVPSEMDVGVPNIAIIIHLSRI